MLAPDELMVFFVNSPVSIDKIQNKVFMSVCKKTWHELMQSLLHQFISSIAKSTLCFIIHG
jgi:hypothetical protein